MRPCCELRRRDRARGIDSSPELVGRHGFSIRVVSLVVVAQRDGLDAVVEDLLEDAAEEPECLLVKPEQDLERLGGGGVGEHGPGASEGHGEAGEGDSTLLGVQLARAPPVDPGLLARRSLEAPDREPHGPLASWGPGSP
jgi:hypothetical protein